MYSEGGKEEGGFLFLFHRCVFVLVHQLVVVSVDVDVVGHCRC